MLGKKIPTLLALLLLIVVVGSVFWFWQRGKSGQSVADTVPQEVKITNVADNKFSVSWTTKATTSGKVEYGNVGEKLEKIEEDDRGEGYVGRTHHITITDLQPQTNYAFRILSGEPIQRFDNNGSVYTVTTGSTIASVPAARSLYGSVSGATEDTILYVAMADAQPASITLTTSGTYSVALSTLRSADLTSFVTYDPAATVISLTLDNGLIQSQVAVSTMNITPVPTIAMGKNEDFRTVASTQQPEVTQIAQVEPQKEEVVAEPAKIFNVEPLADTSINAVTSGSYTLTNPAVEGEVLSTTKPEFRGTGMANATMTVAVTGQKTVSDTIRIGSGGTWSWSPAIPLTVGKQKITLTYTDKDGKQQKIERGFSVTNTSVTSEPAFVATPSATIESSPSATPTSTPSPRVGIPATESGVPVTGVMTPMLLTGALGFAIMIVGALLLAF